MTWTDDIEAALGRDLTAAETTRASRLVELAIGKVEAKVPGLTLSEGTETVTVRVVDRSTVWTPRYPVTELTTLSVDGSTIADTLYTTDLAFGRVDLRTSAPLNEWELNLTATTFWWASPITVTYDYGLDPTTDDGLVGLIAGMVASVIRRTATNPDAVQSERLGSYEVSHGDYSARMADRGLALPDDAEDVLRKWRRNRHVSVALEGR